MIIDNIIMLYIPTYCKQRRINIFDIGDKLIQLPLSVYLYLKI